MKVQIISVPLGYDIRIEEEKEKAKTIFEIKDKKRGKIKEFSRKSRRNMLKRVNMLSYKPRGFLTVKFLPEYQEKHDPDMRKFRAVLWKKAKKYKIKLFYRAEAHKDGRVHYHIITNNYERTKEMAKELKRYVIGKIPEREKDIKIHMTRTEPVQSDGVIAYITKYVSKESEHPEGFRAWGTNDKIVWRKYIRGNKQIFETIMMKISLIRLQYPGIKNFILKKKDLFDIDKKSDGYLYGFWLDNKVGLSWIV